jgi:hypothetical protein
MAAAMVVIALVRVVLTRLHVVVLVHALVGVVLAEVGLRLGRLLRGRQMMTLVRVVVAGLHVVVDVGAGARPVVTDVVVTDV